MSIIQKFISFILITMCNIYYWKNRGFNYKMSIIRANFKDNVNEKKESIKIEECDESFESEIILGESYESQVDFNPVLSSINSNDFDQYRSKHLVI